MSRLHTAPSALAAVLFSVLLLQAASATPAPASERIHLRGVTLDVDELPAPDPAAIAGQDDPARPRLWILHLTGSPGSTQRSAIRAAGGEILGYLPVNAFTVRATPATAAELAELPLTDAIVEFQPEWKLAPELGRAPLPGGRLRVCLAFAPGADVAALEDAARALGAEISSTSAVTHRPRIWAVAQHAALNELARLPDLLWLSENLPITDRNDDIKWACQSGIPDSIPIWEQGLHGEGQILGHLDSNFDLEVCWFEDPEGDPVGPDHRKLAYLGDAPPVNPNPNHGTHTAGTLAGDREPITGETARRGLAYEARIAHTNRGSIHTGYDLYTDLATHHEQGARVHSNSYGQDYITEYTELCYDIDRFSWDFEDDMVAFASTNTTTLYTPENAKNVLAVGATWAGPLYNKHFLGGEGPTADGRRKPEIYAPGYLINSARGAVPCQEISLSGTSMACPAITAGAALARQYYTEGWHPSGAPVPADAIVPSGALLRATLINATFPMDSLPAGYPNDLEGWGRLALDESLHFAGELRRLWLADRRHASGLETGGLESFLVNVLSGDTPLKITLAFSDYPGDVAAAFPVVNDLDLEVLSPAGLYLGNVFNVLAEESALGGEVDPLNSIERVIVKDPAPGIWEIRVRGTNVPMGPQGFAVVAAGDISDDVTPPSLILSFFQDPEAAEPVLELRTQADEALDPASLSLVIGGETQDPGELSEDGLDWSAAYPLVAAAESLGLQLCASDGARNETCVEAAIAIAPIDAAAGGSVSSPDGDFHLVLAPGALPRDLPLVVHPFLVGAGGAPREFELLIADYSVSPALELAGDAPALLNFDYPAGELPQGVSPDMLLVRLDGEALPSFHDADRGLVSARCDALGWFSLELGEPGSSEAVDPAYLDLGQNYPNPFNPGTTIRFELRATQRASLVVYDVLGRELTRLIDGETLLLGAHEREWDGRDASGEPAAAGAYFARLETASGTVQVVKMILIH